jgi:16S rRNA (cytosine1402-N4)-methyltransferase
MILCSTGETCTYRGYSVSAARTIRSRMSLRYRLCTAVAFAAETRRVAMRHDPVMVEEVLHLLQLQSGDVAVDATLGLGGHAARFADAVAPGGAVVGFDWDESMLEEARRRLGSREDVRLHVVHSDFRQVGEVMGGLGLRANGILMDLGLNSAQIEDPSRGISFQQEGPLDMRMDRSKGEPASAMLNRLGPDEIERILWQYGDERWARAIAKSIVERRKSQPLRTTQDLVDVVLATIPSGARDRRIHPATRTFQAVRIAVNAELEGLAEALEAAADVLAPGGTLAVLSYHSGEDRIVKQVFRRLAQGEAFEDQLRKPAQATADEVSRNPRSRSAKLRALRRRTG